MQERATEPKYSMRKVAELISCSVSKVSRMMDQHEIGFYQIGRRRLVGQTHLNAFLARVEQNAKADDKACTQ